MKFIDDGPNIDPELISKHSEGKLLFFCGAGISVPAGLPTFKDLIEKICENLNLSFEKEQHKKTALDKNEYDKLINLIEADLVGGRIQFRKQVAKELKITNPNLLSNTIHEALLTLSKTSDGQTRLITTNFDRFFELAKEKNSLDIPTVQSDELQNLSEIPNGIIYLHDLLSESPQDDEFEKLVLSTSDIGQAYLKKAWAAKFLCKVFEKFNICFIGYSINDPIIRYLVDAFAAERKSNASNNLKIFAFADYSNNKEQTKLEWEAKGVTPILYNSINNHNLLSETIKTWAELYALGNTQLEKIILEEIDQTPVNNIPTKTLARISWGLNHLSDFPTQAFSKINPSNVADWLKKLLTAEIAWISFFYSTEPPPKWDPRMQELTSWLLKHLIDGDELLVYFCEKIYNGEKIHPEFIKALKKHLENTHPNRSKAKQQRRKLWDLLAKDRIICDQELEWVDTKENEHSFFQSAIEPCLCLDELFRAPCATTKKINDPNYISSIIEKITNPAYLSFAINTRINLPYINELNEPNELAQNYFSDVDQALIDTIALIHNIITPDYDFNSVISTFPRNDTTLSDFFDWTILIKILHDAQIKISETNPEKSAQIINLWKERKDPVFEFLVDLAEDKTDCPANNTNQSSQQIPSNLPEEIIPKELPELIEWLKNSLPWSFNEKKWKSFCKNNPELVCDAIKDLFHERHIPSNALNLAISAWLCENKDSLLLTIWKNLSLLFINLEDKNLQEISNLPWFLNTISEKISQPDRQFINLSNKIISVNLEESPSPDEPNLCHSARNSPIGWVTKGLFKYYLKGATHPALPDCLKELIISICQTESASSSYTQIILGTYLSKFFQKDPEWTKAHLIPLLIWPKNCSNFKLERTSDKLPYNLWTGFIEKLTFPSPINIFDLIPNTCLQVLRHLDKFEGKIRGDYITYFFTKDEIRELLNQVDRNTLDLIAQTLANQSKSDYCKKIIIPFIKKNWPTSKQKHSPKIACSFALICLNAEHNFPDAVETLQFWLPLEIAHPEDFNKPVIRALLSESSKSTLYENHPVAFLKFLAQTFSEVFSKIKPSHDHHQDLSNKLKGITDKITQKDPSLAENADFKKLRNLFNEE